MYTVGSLFYAIYFFVSFPMFYRMDEDGKVRGGVAAGVGRCVIRERRMLCRWM